MTQGVLRLEGCGGSRRKEHGSPVIEGWDAGSDHETKSTWSVKEPRLLSHVLILKCSGKGSSQ